MDLRFRIGSAVSQGLESAGRVEVSGPANDLAAPHGCMTVLAC